MISLFKTKIVYVSEIYINPNFFMNIFLNKKNDIIFREKLIIKNDRNISNFKYTGILKYKYFY